MKKLFILAFVLEIFFVCSLASAQVQILEMLVECNEERDALTKEYSRVHYGKDITTIVPKAVIVHWTAANTWESTYNWFLSPSRADGTLNVCSHFLVDRDGTIYRLLDETYMARHTIGYNWCAIGIENVGGVHNEENLTLEQLNANIELIRYLHDKYPSIQYVFGHYQQVAARESGLYIEHVEGYHSVKLDPGSAFMKGLGNNLSDDGLIFFPE